MLAIDTRRNWTIPVGAILAEGLFQAIEKDFIVSHDQQNGTYILSKQLLSPILITSYDPDMLCFSRNKHFAYLVVLI